MFVVFSCARMLLILFCLFLLVLRLGLACSVVVVDGPVAVVATQSFFVGEL